MKWYLFWAGIYLLAVLFLSSSVFALEKPTFWNLGFLKNNIWYSKDPFFDGDVVRIYSLIFNSSKYDLEGTVEFFDNGNSLGKSNFSLSGNGRTYDVWVDWKAKSGAHKISAKIVKARVSLPGEASQEISLGTSETGESDVVVSMGTESVAEEKKMPESGQQNKEPISWPSGVVTVLSNGTFRALGVIDTMREGGSTLVEKKLEAVKNDLALKDKEKNSRARSSGQNARAEVKDVSTPLEYAYLILLTGLGSILNYRFLFYIILLVALYCLFKSLRFLVHHL